MKTCFVMLAASLACSAATKVPKPYFQPLHDRSSEVVESSGVSEEELERILDDIEREEGGRPFVATRARWLEAIMDRTRLAVAPGDVFVDWFPGWFSLTARRARRVAAFGNSDPQLSSVKGAGLGGMHGASLSTLDSSHVCPDWESVLSLGPRGLADRARKRRETAKTDRERLFLDSVAKVYDAMSRLCVRWADAAEGRAASGCAETLREIAVHPPRTLREALQLMLVYDRCQEAEGECVRSQGLFDRLYLRYYRDDLAAGRETRDSAKALIRALFLKFYVQGHPNGKNIGFGGYGRDGEPVWNELTEIGFELHEELNHINPKLTYRFGRKTPREQLLKVARCLAHGRTSVVFLNEETSREMFVRRGKDPSEAADAVLVGCYEPAIQGREVIASMSTWINLAKPLEAVFNCGRGFDGALVGEPCDLPRTGAEFEAEYLRQLEVVSRRALEATRVYERNWYDLNPSPLMSGAFRDCIANARDAYDGGMKYNQSGVMCSGLGTAVDSLAAVKYIVDEAKLATMEELKAALMADWSGADALRLAARRRAPKWGNNDDRADTFARRLTDALTACVNATPNGHGGTYQTGLWSIDNDFLIGSLTAATPDGRKAKDPLSRNNMAAAGCGREGATALMLSNAKLDVANVPNGHILDLVLPASLAQDSRGAENIAAVLRSFSDMGGQCIHLNCFDSRVLRDAKAHPEKYPDLQVRVCGWNARWQDLSPREQDHFIATAEAQER